MQHTIMKKRIFLIMLLISNANISITWAYQYNKEKEYVLICKSGTYQYHTHMCKTLTHCVGGIVKITKYQAIKMGYRPCKYCYYVINALPRHAVKHSL